MFSRTCAVYVVGLILLTLSAPLAGYDLSTLSPASQRHVTHPKRADGPSIPLHHFEPGREAPPGRDDGRVKITDSELPFLAQALSVPSAHGDVAPPLVAAGARHSPLRI